MKTRFAFSMAILVLMLGILAASNSFADIIFSQLSKYEGPDILYDPDGAAESNHYRNPDAEHPGRTGAVKRGTSDLPILYIELKDGSTLKGLEVYYIGNDITDVGPNVKLIEDLDPVVPPVLKDEEDRLVKRVSFIGLRATFAALNEKAPDVGSRYYFVTLDVKSGADSNEVDLAVTGLEGDYGTIYKDGEAFAGDPRLDNILDPNGRAQIDAARPTFDSVEYDKGTKVLTIRFNDGSGITGVNVTYPRINVVDRSDGTAVWKINLSKLRIQDQDDENQINLNGAKFLYPDYPIPGGPTDPADYVIPSSDLHVEPTAADTQDPTSIWFGYQYPLNDDTMVNRADQIDPDYAGVVKILLTSNQAADFENKFPSEAGVYEDKIAELDILAGALMDHVFDNSIEEKLDQTINISREDWVEPKLLTADKKPVKFNYETRILTLDFSETINAVTAGVVDLAKIYIMNYKIVEELDEDGNIIGNVPVIDEDSVMNIARGADVTKVYDTTVTIKLTDSTQIDVLKGDHPQLYLDAGAVKDVAGNGNLALNADSMDNDGADVDEGGAIDITTTLKKYIQDYLRANPDLVGYGDNLIDAANVYVTPLLLSGAESVYDGDQFDETYTYIPFDLKFSEEISEVANVTRIRITNENDENPFNLAPGEYDTIVEDNNGLTTIARFKLWKSHRDKISYWQSAGMEELRIQLDAGAVVDIYGSSNEPMTVSERIVWDKDDTGPALTDSSTYNYSTRLLRLRFNEILDLTPELGETIDDLIDPSKITLSNPVAPDDSFALKTATEEAELVPDQDDDWWLEYTLTSNQNDKITGWQGDGAEEINISVAVGAVKDVNDNPAGAITRVITEANWIRDKVKPTFVAAYYSKELRSLVIRFNESISDVGAFKPALGKIFVHAAGKGRVALGTSDYKVVGEALIIENLGDDAHNAIKDVGNPQVDIDEAAVHDLAGNAISGTPHQNRPITHDVSGPELSTTGNTYEHISLDEEGNVVQDGLLTLTFEEIVDVSEIDTAKIKLVAGSTSISLIGAIKPTEDAQTIEIKIEDDETVGEIASLQLEYTTLYVTLEAEAVKDLAGNDNVEDTQALEEWIGDTRKPELDHDKSYYIHDFPERGQHYARLVLVFDELMETRAGYINFSGIVVANPGGDSVTLTAEELIPDQGLSKEIQFNLTTDGHRDTISDWGKPTASTSGEGKGYNELHIYLAEGAVVDRAGNSVLVEPVQLFAVAKADDPDTPDIDEREVFPDDLAKGSTWEKDLRPAEYVSSTYNANDKWMTITFDEWMDQKPKDTTVQPEKITITDKNGENGVTLMAGAADWTEQEKTKTVKFKLTPEKDVAVKALAEPLYLYMEEGAAVDFGGVGSAAVTKQNKKKITYTKDTTKPTLVRTNGDDTTYRHKGKDFGAPDDITGLLSLVFNEGVDKDYDAIDASKIRLSNTSSGGGFVLTQSEIYTAAGYRVYPLAASRVHIIQFDLNDAHWNSIASEKWDKMYIQMEAGAVKDTSGNSIDAVTIDIDGDHYFPDDVAPDVRLPASPISSASVGQDITITAHSITDDSPITEVRLYYQVGGSVPTYVVMENTTGNAYEGTIPGTAVTNKGLCYYVWAVDLWDNENITGNGNIKTRKGDSDDMYYTSIPGGFNVEVTDASAELAANTLPVFDPAAVPSTYRMLSVPLNASPTSTTLFTPFGTAGVNWMAWRFTGGPEYNGYQAGHITPFTFSPGVAAWVGTVNPDKALTVTGKTTQVSDKYENSDEAGKRYLYEITLHAGWNQIAVPFNFSRNWDDDTIDNVNIADTIYWFTGEKSAYSFASLNPNVPNQDVFETAWTGSGIPDNELVWSGWPGSLDPWGGYWIYSNREGAKLKIDPTVPGKGVMPTTPTAPSVQMPYNWSVKVMPEASGVPGTAKFAGIVADATDEIDKYDVMDLPALPGQTARLSFITEAGDYLQDMRAPADEMFWHFKVSSDVNTPVTLRFDASAVPSEYRTVLLIDNVTEAATDLRKVASYAYKSSEKIRNFKLIISKAHPETYIVPKRSVLLQNYPNPFNPETWVPYRLAKPGDVTIKIYNIAGQLVRTLELGHREAGSYTAKERAAYWNGRNDTGERVASGMYFYYIQSGSFHATKRMVIVK